MTTKPRPSNLATYKVRWLALVLAIFLGAGCERTTEDRILVRFIKADPPDLFEPSVLEKSSHTFDWSFDRADAQASLDEIHFVDGTGILRHGGLYLSTKNRRVWPARPHFDHLHFRSR